MANCPLCYVTGKGCPAQDYISQHHLLLNVVLLLLLMNEMGVTVVCVTYGACLRVTFGPCLLVTCLFALRSAFSSFPWSAHSAEDWFLQTAIPQTSCLALTRFSQPGHLQDTVGREPGWTQDISTLISLLQVTSLLSQLLTNSPSFMSQLLSSLLCSSDR